MRLSTARCHWHADNGGVLRCDEDRSAARGPSRDATLAAEHRNAEGKVLGPSQQPGNRRQDLTGCNAGREAIRPTPAAMVTICTASQVVGMVRAIGAVTGPCRSCRHIRSGANGGRSRLALSAVL